MKLLLLAFILSVVACSGKKRIPFNQKLIDLQVETTIAEAQKKVDTLKESLKEEGLLCELSSREERKEIFLVPKTGDGQNVSYTFYDIDENSTKTYGASIEGFRIYLLRGRSMLNKDGSQATAINGLIFPVEPEEKPMDPSFNAHFVIEESEDRGIKITSIIETKPLKGTSTTRELAQIDGCVKTKL